MKRHLKISLVAILILLFGCDKGNDPDDINIPEYVISSFDYSNDNDRGVNFQYPVYMSYSNGLLTRKIIHSYDPSIQQVDYYYTSKVLDSIVVTNSNNKLSSREEFIYTYENDLLVKVKQIYGGSLTFCFNYDSTGQLAEQIVTYYWIDPYGEYHYHYFLIRYYFENGNIIRRESYSRESPADEYVPNGISFYTYDDNINPFIISLDKAFMIQPYCLDICFWNKNNVLIDSLSFGWNSGKWQYFYTYNDDGYPTSIQQVDALGYKSSYRNIKYKRK